MDFLTQIGAILEMGRPVIAAFLAQYPFVIAALAVLGGIRFFMKPTVTFVRAIVAQTPTKKDDAALAKVESSKITKILVFLADWLLSLKLQAPAPVVAPAPVSPEQPPVL